MYQARYAMQTFIAMQLLAGIGVAHVAEVRARWVGATMIALMVVVSMPRLRVLYRDTQNEDWRRAGAFLDAHVNAAATDDDLVLWCPDFVAAPTRFYAHRPFSELGVPGASAAGRAMPFDIGPRAWSRVWLVQYPPRAKLPRDEQGKRRLLGDEYELRETVRFFRVEIDRFERVSP
jgi:hypothetical protein